MVQLYDGTCQNLLRGDKAQILVICDCQSGLIQSLHQSCLLGGRSIAYSGECLYIF